MLGSVCAMLCDGWIVVLVSSFLSLIYGTSLRINQSINQPSGTNQSINTEQSIDRSFVSVATLQIERMNPGSSAGLAVRTKRLKLV